MNKAAVFGGTVILGLSLILAACNTPPIDTGNTFTPPAISGFTYVPADVTVKVGTEITLPAEAIHPLKGNTAETDNPIPARSVAAVKVKFDKVGKFTFFCENHGTATGGMKGTVTVTN
jgi:plastocyanin